MAGLTENLVKQKRFGNVLKGLLVLALLLGLVIVPVEQHAAGARITNYFDGVWWSVTTITSVGYGDMVPVTRAGKVMGMLLQISGVLAFGLLVSLVTVSLNESKEKYYRRRLEERLDGIDTRLVGMEKKEDFLVRNEMKEERTEI